MQSIYSRQLLAGFDRMTFNDALEADFHASGDALSSSQRLALLGCATVALTVALISHIGSTLAFTENATALRSAAVGASVLMLLIASFRLKARHQSAAGVTAGALVAAVWLSVQPTSPDLLGYFVIVVSSFLMLGLRFWPAVVNAVLQLTMFVTTGVGYLTLPDFATGLGVGGLAALLGGYALYRLEWQQRASFLKDGELRLRATLDPVTEMANRSAFDDYFERVWQHAQRERLSLSVLHVNVDHFDAYNGRYGRSGGDRCLSRIARLVEDVSQRPLDFAARYDEARFVVVLPDCTEHSAFRIAEDLRRRVIACVIEHADSPTSALLTVSIGVAGGSSGDAQTTRQSLIQRSDAALREAQLAGCNRVVRATTDSLENADNVIQLSAARRARRQRVGSMH